MVVGSAAGRVDNEIFIFSIIAGSKNHWKLYTLLQFACNRFVLFQPFWSRKLPFSRLNDNFHRLSSNNVQYVYRP